MRQFTASWAILLLFVGAPTSLLACGGGDEVNEPTRVASSAAEGLANRVGVATTGGVDLAADGEDDGEEGAKDYWADISFDRTNFDEVLHQVKRHYIDQKYDRVWAYAQAATFALASHEDSGRLIYPEAFYKARKDDPDEKGGLKGKVTKLRPDDPFVILDVVKDKDEEEEPRKRLSDAEIRELRDKSKARTKALHAAWDATGFGEDDFERVMGYILREFKPSEKWTIKNGWIAAAQGYLYGLDPHSSLVAKSAWEESTRRTKDASFEGIGAILTQRPDSNYTIVENPIQGQPAVKAGLRAGDAIVRVDGKDIKDEPLSKVVSRIRGPKGTTVVLSVLREGEPDTKDISITRSSIEIKNVTGRLIKGHDDIGVIKVTGFIKSTEDDLVAEYERLSKQTKSGKLRGLVLDMRDNSGGLLNQGIRVADRFLRSGVIVSVRSNQREDEVYYAHNDSSTWDVPVVVLVNDGTASAAEIVASAIQDNQRGIVVGDRTFGKASVQTLYSPLLQDDYYIKLTVARYYSPSGRTLQVTGVLPDAIIPPEYGKDMPLGFREENLSGHLVPLDFDYTSPNKGAVERLNRCVAATGKAIKAYEAEPNPAIKYDYQLMHGADLLECGIADRAAVRRGD